MAYPEFWPGHVWPHPFREFSGSDSFCRLLFGSTLIMLKIGHGPIPWSHPGTTDAREKDAPSCGLRKSELRPGLSLPAFASETMEGIALDAAACSCETVAATVSSNALG